MQRIIEFILKYKEHFVFLGFVFISLSFILLGDINKIGGFRTIVVATLGWIQKKVFLIPNISALKSENSALRELNFILSQKVINSRRAEIENITLRKMLELKERFEIPAEVADVVGAVTIDLRNFIIINKGKKSGILPLMTVRNDAGLVGLVVSTSNNYSLVELIINANVKVPALDIRSGVLGTINWDGSGNLLLRDVAKFVDVRAGDTIVTSKFSMKYVPNVPIGVVVSKEEEEGELFSKIVVKPFVNFSFLEEVFVLKSLVDPELLRLMKEYEARAILSKQTTPKSLKLNPRKLMDERRIQDSLKKIGK